MRTVAWERVNSDSSRNCFQEVGWEANIGGFVEEESHAIKYLSTKASASHEELMSP